MSLDNLVKTLDNCIDTLKVSTDCKILLGFVPLKSTVATFDGTDVILLEGVDRWYEIEIDFKYQSLPCSFDPEDSSEEEVRYVGEIIGVTSNDENDDPYTVLLCEHTKVKLVEALNDRNIEL